MSSKANAGALFCTAAVQYNVDLYQIE